MRELLKECIQEEDGFVELRYHKKESRSFYAEKERIENSSIKKRSGVGVRVLINGSWGFAFTSEIDKSSIQKALENAKKSARNSAPFRKEKIQSLAKGRLAVGNFPGKGVQDLASKTIEEKIALVFDTQKKANHQSSLIQSNCFHLLKIANMSHLILY